MYGSVYVSMLHVSMLLSAFILPSPHSPPGVHMSIHMSVLPLLLLLLLSRFSRVQLCATPLTAAQQASPPLGLSRQEQWSGLPFPSPMHAWKWKVKVKLLSHVWAYQAPPSMGLSRQEYWRGVLLPSPAALHYIHLMFYAMIFCCWCFSFCSEWESSLLTDWF